MKRLIKPVNRTFASSGPYNPLRYKTHMAPRSYPKDKEIEEYYKTLYSIPSSPVRNVRHVNPVRQSGPLPAYDGSYTMEDISKIFFNSTIGRDFNYCSTDPEEIMRRVPGITRKEAEHITKLGLTPDEEVDLAYIVYNNGIDIFYNPNGVYVNRQVVTNSKGEKVEVYWNSQSFEEMALVNVTHAPALEFVDYHWEIFLWGEPPIHPLVDFDLAVPNTWFEYEEDNWGLFNILEDQFGIPEDIRRESERHPNARKELWKSQEDWFKIEQMKDPNWTPSDLEKNIYNVENFVPKVKKRGVNDRVD